MNPHLLHPATGPVATAITRCMDAYFPRHRPAFARYQVTLLIDDHLTETTHIEARNPKEAFTRALDARTAQAIRAHRPDLTIRPHTILRLVA